MAKDKPKKLHDNPFYKATKTATCATVSGLLSWLSGGSAPVYGTVNTVCDSVSDAVANPIHVLVHGKSYEEMHGKEESNKKVPKP